MDELIDSIFRKGNEWNVIIAAFILGAVFTLIKIGIKKLLKKPIYKPTYRTPSKRK